MSKLGDAAAWRNPNFMTCYNPAGSDEDGGMGRPMTSAKDTQNASLARDEQRGCPANTSSINGCVNPVPKSLVQRMMAIGMVQRFANICRLTVQ